VICEQRFEHHDFNYLWLAQVANRRFLAVVIVHFLTAHQSCRVQNIWRDRLVAHLQRILSVLQYEDGLARRLL